VALNHSSTNSRDAVCDTASKNSAFVFIKPHANTPATQQLVADTFKQKGIRVLEQGELTGQQIDEVLTLLLTHSLTAHTHTMSIDHSHFTHSLTHCTHYAHRSLIFHSLSHLLTAHTMSIDHSHFTPSLTLSLHHSLTHYIELHCTSRESSSTSTTTPSPPRPLS
jgi:hypothetical protein